MGETTSSWKLPLHSSDSEHPEQKRRESRGNGRNEPAVEHGTAPMFQGGNDKGSRATAAPVSARNNPFRR